MMNKKTKDKKYFVKDESLHTVDNDMFNYADIAKVLNDIIDNNEPPYNVAIIGKWGLGKSSLINLVINGYRNRSKDFLIQEINAWKYEKESLRKVFLKQLWQGISDKKVRTFDIIKKEYANIVNSDIESIPTKEKPCKFWKFTGGIALICFITIIAFAIYKIIQANVLDLEIWNWDFWGKAILSYCKNIGTILIIPALVALIKILLDNYNKPAKKVELNFPIETTDDYEIFLETKIKEKLDDNPNLKIITVIDDLDRLSIDKIVEALDALKAFVGFKKCIFLVPFDDEIIKQALNKRRAKQFNDEDDVVESELILDKLFQFKIYLPPLLAFDIKKYAIELSKQEIPDFISEFCNENLMKKAIRVLMHESVSTPRQVKKLLNSFINNMMVAFARENSGKVQKGLLTNENGIMQIAIISVLQSDFNDFYDILFKDINSIEKILDIHRNEVDKDDIPENLKKYFILDNDDSLVLRKEHEALLNFLTKIEKYRVPSLLPYLYLAQDDISIKTGDELQRRLSNALKSGNEKTVKELIAENENLSEVILNNLENEHEDISEVISVAIAVFDSIFSNKKEIAREIVERGIELSDLEIQSLYPLPPQNIMDITMHCENRDFASEFMVKYINIFINEKSLEIEELLSALKMLLSNYEKFDYNEKNAVKKLVEFCVHSESVSAESLFDVVDYSKRMFNELWGISWFNKVCMNLDSENDFSETYIQHLIDSFDVLKSQADVNLLIEPLVTLIRYSALMESIANILNDFVDDEKSAIVKEIISRETATKVFEACMQCDLDENYEYVVKILKGLSFNLTKETATLLDDFLAHNIPDDEAVCILQNITQHGNITYVPKTIDEISKKVFSSDEYDMALSVVFQYLSNDQKQQITNKLSNSSNYTANKVYQREQEIYRIVCKDSESSGALDNIVNNVLVPQFRTNHVQQKYFDFFANVIGILKDIISQDKIDLCVKELLVVFSSKRKACLEAINQIPLKMSEKQFEDVFNKIVSEVADAEFEIALDVIINNDELRPTDTKNLSAYITFLTDNLETSDDPNRIVRTISRSFGRISKNKEMIENALKNDKTDMVLLMQTSGMFINNSKTLEKLAEELVNVCSVKEIEEKAIEILNGITTYNCDDIFGEISQKIDVSTNVQSIKAIFNMAIQSKSSVSARDLILKCLQISLSADTNIKMSIDFIRKINDNKSSLSIDKAGINAVLIDGFVSTTSESLKESIINLVRTLKIKTLFKKELSGENLKFYEKWVK